MGENGNKKRATATICCSPFGCHYSRDIMLTLKKTLSNFVSVFFKTSTLSEIFVHLSAVRWHFSAPFQSLKISIFATFPLISPACPPQRESELFPHIKQIPSHTKYPLKSPVFSRHGPARAVSFAPDIPIQFLYRHPIVFALSGGSYDQDVFGKEIVHFRHKLISLGNKISTCPVRRRSIPGWTLGMDWGYFSLRKSSRPGRIRGIRQCTN